MITRPKNWRITLDEATEVTQEQWDYLSNTLKEVKMADPNPGFCEQVSVAYDGPPAYSQESRERIMELHKIAYEVCDFLEKKGITKAEGCKVRQFAELLWEHKKEVKKRVRSQRLSNRTRRPKKS